MGSIRVVGHAETRALIDVATVPPAAVHVRATSPWTRQLPDGLSVYGSLGEKASLQPRVWRQIQQFLGMSFDLLQTPDAELVDLSRALFEDHRDQVDVRLATRSPVASATEERAC